MVAQSYEMDLHVAEQWAEGKGFSYFAIVFGEHLTLDVPLDLSQIAEVLEEIPDSFYQKEGFWRRDFFAVCHLNAEQWANIYDYQETGVDDGEAPWGPEDGGPVSWEDWDAVEAYLESMPLMDDEDTDIEDEEGWDPDDCLDEDEWVEGDAEDFLGEGDEDLEDEEDE